MFGERSKAADLSDASTSVMAVICGLSVNSRSDVP
jgi:hypothetical protein